MGYACPVCDDPQSDARHLANHLAFTAILGDEDHEAWLDEHAPGWADDGEQALAERVAEHAEQREYPQLFEDTTGQGDGDPERDDERSGKLFEDEGHEGHDHLGGEHDHGHDHGAGPGADVPHEQADVPRDPETEAVLEEARELTREMLAEEDEERGAEDGDEDESETQSDDR